MTESQADDLRLVQRLCQGEAAAARDLYRRHGAALLRFALAMSRNPQTAEDVVHDTFVEFLRNPHGFDVGRGTVLTYLFGIARHQMSRFTRQSDAARAGFVGEEMLADVAVDVLTEEHIDQHRMVERVRRAVLDLPPAQREVIALCDLQDLPYDMVASILDCPIGTVRSRLHRARELLARRLDPARGKDASTRAEARAGRDNLPRGATEGGAADESADVRFACRGTST